MKVWMLMTEVNIEKLMKYGKLTAEDLAGADTSEELRALLWLGRRMKQNEILSTHRGGRPLVLTYQNNGKKHFKLGETEAAQGLVLAAFEVPEETVQLFDAALYGYVERYRYLPADEEDLLRYDRMSQMSGMSDEVIRNRRDTRMSVRCTRKLLESSWERIFDLRKEDGLFYGVNSRKTICAAVWEIRREQVLYTEGFNMVNFIGERRVNNVYYSRTGQSHTPICRYQA